MWGCVEMSGNNSNDSLQEYLDSLLNDTLLGASGRVADESVLKFAAGSNIAPLPTTPRPVRAIPTRPYAEPISTLNLRMPLPAIGPAVETSPAVTLSEASTIVEADTSVETASAIETVAVVEAKTVEVVETVALLETAPLAEVKPLVEAEQDLLTLEAITEPALAPDVAAQTTVTENNAGLATMAPPSAWLPNGRPQWAQVPFECLIFKVGGLQLAAPLVELGSIYPLENTDALTEIFGQKQWFMGLLPVKEYNVRTMDTALVVMPERYDAAMRDNYRYVVSLFGSDWGLAADAVVGTTLLDPAAVRWRGERSKRPWLAGTLIDQMCALFDIAQLAWLFHNQDRKRVSR